MLVRLPCVIHLCHSAQGDVYYYGCNDLFTRHPEVMKRLCVSAPVLLDTLLNGLVWRSRQTKEGSLCPEGKTWEHFAVFNWVNIFNQLCCLMLAKCARLNRN